ncbi:MAG: sialate O-acetylesterase [Eubacteriales bacterium]
MMFTLPKIFTDGALFQADASLILNGRADGDAEITGKIFNRSGLVASASAHSAADGTFTLELRTPAASFEPHEISLHCGRCGCDCTMHDVLFGELWLASGQSNMELPNYAIPDMRLLYEKIKGKKIRVYHVDYPPYGGGGAFPWEPDHGTDGEWMTADDTTPLAKVSAVGLKFAAELYEWLNRAEEVPVGFLNASWGGTSMPSWFPLDALDADETLRSRMQAIGNYPTPENWNNRGDCNFQQTCAQYNVKIAPLEGVKVRGVLWYQGENEAGGEFYQKIYADYLRFYHKTYAERFAADPEHFLMISSLIYPWTYGGSGECSIGYLNNAFVETAKETPDKFAAAPIGDLAPSWAYHQNNHPIHPTNKYPLGERMASLALDNVYGRGWEQKSPAHLTSWEICGNRIRLTFAPVGFGLYVNGERPVGLYIAGEDNVYLPAECAMETGSDTMEIWCDAIPEPKNAAYAVQSLEPCCNLWGGMYPLYPFYTDRETCLNIEARPWYDTFRTSVWASQMHDNVLDLFYHPIWQPEPGSEVCPDKAFTLEGQSLRVCSDQAVFGCFVKSYPYNRLDLQKFARLSVNLYNTVTLTARLILEWDGGAAEIPLVKTADLRGGWHTYEAPLTPDVLPRNAEIRKMHFRFTHSDCLYPFVNLETVRLWKE